MTISIVTVTNTLTDTSETFNILLLDSDDPHRSPIVFSAYNKESAAIFSSELLRLIDDHTCDLAHAWDAEVV
jgi:hypothetical protein